VTYDKIMSYDPANIYVFKALEKHLTSERKPNVVPFVGAGLSVEFGFPTWKSFLEEGFRRFDVKIRYAFSFSCLRQNEC